MSRDKMVEKAKEVLEKQKELNYLVLEMKNEVRAVEDENVKLQEEVAILRAQLQEKDSSIVVNTKAIQEKSRVLEKLQKDKLESVKVVDLPDVKVKAIVNKPVITETKTSPIRTERQNSLIEFFLGKNVIVKIAAVLMILAVITFGQIAYVDFLNNLGRFILILSVGFLFIGAGNLFERKSADVYGNIFYILGLSVLLANNFFGLYQYELYNHYVFMYLLLPLLFGPLVYFYNKRDSFLDFVLNIFYLVVMFIPITIFMDNEIEIHAFLLISLVILITGFAVYRNYTHHMNKFDKFAIGEFLVLFISSVAIVLPSYSIVDTSSISLAHINVFMYQLFFVFIYYVIHFRTMEHRNFKVQIFILITTSIAFFILGSGLSRTFNVLINQDNTSLSTLFAVLLFIPIYIYMFRKKEDKRLTNIYLIILSITALLFTFIVESKHSNFTGNYYYEVLEPYLKNIILVSEVLVLYFFSRFTKDKMQKYISYGFMTISLLYSLIHFIPNGFAFKDYTFFLPTIFAGVAVYLLFKLINPSHSEREEHDVVKFYALSVFIPFMIVFAKELILDDTSVILTVLVFYFIGVRYLFNIKVFQSLYQEKFSVGINIGIVVLVFLINFSYFDHNFNNFSDVFKLLVVGGANVYIIQSLREIAIFADKRIKKPELIFIVFYVLGVIIQAVYITQFINFEFDKVILSSYYMISAAVAILYGFRMNWFNVRKIGLFAIYFSLAKFFVYDLWTNDFNLYVRLISYTILATVLFGIAGLYSYLEKTYGSKEEIETEEK